MFSTKWISLDVSFPTKIEPSTEPRKRSFLFKIQKKEQCTPKTINKPKPKKQAKGKSFVSLGGLTCKMAVHRHSWPRRQMRGCAKTATIALLRNATSSLFFSFLCNQECSLSLSLSPPVGYPFLSSYPWVRTNLCNRRVLFAAMAGSVHIIIITWMWCEPPT